MLHCFTGSAELARKGLDLGFYVSLSGIVTFKNAQDLQETAKWLPADQMLVETDSPFLAPVPHRGQKCEPAFVADTAAFVAELRGEDADQLADTTTANFFKLFGKPKGRKRESPHSGLRDVDRRPQDRQRMGPMRPATSRATPALRTSILVESAGERMLVDCGPDLRQQLLGGEVGRSTA